MIEVLSPSNSAAEMYEKGTIRVASRDAAYRVYQQDETISLAAFKGGELNMNEVFGQAGAVVFTLVANARFAIVPRPPRSDGREVG